MRSKTLAFTGLLLITVFMLTQAMAPHTALADPFWRDSGGPGNGEPISLAYDSGHNLLFAGTDTNGVWKYDGTWNNTGGGVSSFAIESLAYDSVHNLLYAGCATSVTPGAGRGVWKYDGTSWTDISGVISSCIIESLAYDSVHNLLYASSYDSATGTYKGVWKYNGTGWTDTGGGISGSTPSSDLAYDSVHNLLYAGTDGGTVWKYNGIIWADISGNISSDYINCLGYDSVHNLLYAGSSIYDPSIYSYTGDGVWKYDGTSWSHTYGTSMFESLVYDPGHNLLYAGTGQSVMEYDGTTWTNAGIGMSGNSIYSLAYDPVHYTLYAGTVFHGVWYYNIGPPMPPPSQWKSTFYFAEGYTGENFQEYATFENPNGTAADTWITCMFPDGTTQSQYYSLAPASRLTVDMNQLVGAGKEVSMRVVSTGTGMVAERPMYFNYNGAWTGGSDAIGATSANTSWYFAEGNTLDDFDEYITVLNPGDTTANITFHYMVEGLGQKDASGSVGAHSRATFKTRDQIGSNLNASLHLSSDQPVVAERPMYFNYHGAWTGGHDVVGANSPAKSWYLAEGTTRDNFEEWLCLQNPGSSPVIVNARYMLGSGQGDPISKSYTVPARERLTVSVNKEIGSNKDDSVELTSTSDFIAERSMYFDYHGAWTGGHDVLGANATTATWYFAEGTTRDNFNEWLCLQNPGDSDAHVTITYYTSSGQAIPKDWTVSANSRLTVDVNQDAGADQDISAKVSSDQPIICERPMYFDYNGWTGGHDVVGFTP
ncbi:MAG: hypothetical protein KKF41_03415 [Actinobacteria bacterium]|nr:hypothetical protein [Actinomycetota bacterium]MBU1945049.1 hypothetical protein [Actinomycetota bacterium]MBU2686615.1 hypothetical protein [Actinomycetota bacterium]